MNLPSSSMGALAWAMMYLSSSAAVRYSISLVTLPFITLRYGVSRKPKELTRAYVLNEEIRPMLGPSGVSMGHIRP